MKTAFDVYAMHWFATQHAAQDKFFVHEFEHNGQKIHIGALADGATGRYMDPDYFDYRPEIGAKWLVREFAKQAETLYRQGIRGKDLGRSIALNILAGMRDYQPQYSRSKWITGGQYPFCEELVATLYGFVADSKELLVLTSGDGYTLRNGNLRFMEEEQGLYPTLMLSLEEKEWPARLEEVFKIRSLDMARISSFGIASDGLSDCGERAVERAHQQYGEEPHRFVNAVLRPSPEPAGGHDDVTVVYLAVHRS